MTASRNNIILGLSTMPIIDKINIIDLIPSCTYSGVVPAWEISIIRDVAAYLGIDTPPDISYDDVQAVKIEIYAALGEIMRIKGDMGTTRLDTMKADILDKYRVGVEGEKGDSMRSGGKNAEH